jgi:hypothetical protein
MTRGNAVLVLVHFSKTSKDQHNRLQGENQQDGRGREEEIKRKVTIQWSVVQELTVSSSLLSLTTSQKLSKRSESLLGVLWSRKPREVEEGFEGGSPLYGGICCLISAKVRNKRDA